MHGIAVLLCLNAALPAQTPSPSQAPPAAAASRVVLQIGDTKLTAAEFEEFLNMLPPQTQKEARANRRQWAGRLADMRILAAEAKKRKLDQTLRAQVLIGDVLANILAAQLMEQSTVDEKMLRDHYMARKADYEEVKARHILVRTPGSPVPANGSKELTDAEALAKSQALRKQLEGGADFGELARKESSDNGTRESGGELGFLQRGQTVKPFEDAAFALNVGQLSEPVKTQFGYHLIRVDERKSRSFEEVRAEIEKQVRPEAGRRAVEELKKQTVVVYDENYFGPEPQSSKPAPAKQ